MFVVPVCVLVCVCMCLCVSSSSSSSSSLLFRKQDALTRERVLSRNDRHAWPYVRAFVGFFGRRGLRRTHHMSVSSPVTGEKFAIYPMWKRKMKQVVSFLVLLIFNVGLLIMIYWIFKLQQPFSLKSLRKAHLSKLIATQLPTALGYGLVIPVLVVVYDLLAKSFSGTASSSTSTSTLLTTVAYDRLVVPVATIPDETGRD